MQNTHLYRIRENKLRSNLRRAPVPFNICKCLGWNQSCTHGWYPLVDREKIGMGPIEQMYRDFCEKVACECEAEAERYEKHPALQDRDRQFVSVLHDRAKTLRREIRRLDASYSSRAG